MRHFGETGNRAHGTDVFMCVAVGMMLAVSGCHSAAEATADASQGAPDASEGAPDATQGSPDATQGAPDATQGSPDATQGAPDASTLPDLTGVIAPSRRIDWTHAGVQGGIPKRTSVCATLSPGASASQINSAIASCSTGGGGVVSLGAGTYNLASGIDFARHGNVTLRGAGADKTFLVFSGGVACNGPNADICIEGSNSWSGGPENTANWTAGYAKGTTQITLSSTSNLQAKTLLILDQTNDSSDSGGIFVCSAQGVCSLEGPGSAGRTNRSQEQLVQVQSVSGNTVTITPGLYMSNWRTSQSPGAWWANTAVVRDGVEDLSVDHSSSNDKSGILMDNAENCWIKGVRSLDPNRNHVWLYQTIHASIVDSYFYGTLNAMSQSYGIEIYMGSDNLIENNIFQHITGPMMNGGSNTGDVWAYNFSTDDFYYVSAWQMNASWMHAAASNMVLFEGNTGEGLTADAIHGTHHFETAFRNYWNGLEPGKTSQTIPVMLYAGSRFFNLVGNVLGTAGYHTSYQCEAPNGANYNKSIYALGWSGNGSTNSSVPDDPNVASTLLRWGNYDVVNNAVRFESSEVPSGLSRFANPVPSSHKLPASAFLSGPPNFWTTPWGTPPWPAIGPDVTGGNGPGGHAYDIPAKRCYDHSAKDSNGVLTFNASACY